MKYVERLDRHFNSIHGIKKPHKCHICKNRIDLKIHKEIVHWPGHISVQVVKKYSKQIRLSDNMLKLFMVEKKTFNSQYCEKLFSQKMVMKKQIDIDL